MKLVLRPVVGQRGMRIEEGPICRQQIWHTLGEVRVICAMKLVSRMFDFWIYVLKKCHWMGSYSDTGSIPEIRISYEDFVMLAHDLNNFKKQLSFHRTRYHTILFRPGYSEYILIRIH